ncbi:glutamine-dependent amidotransferase, class I [Syntrophotalea carbinolica DSM 2380]|uniref:Glutamine-dependent amidotransferase, class I n=1 Tax=Syntrophotalea carbinolica (strain DSM 2380 / NBRC 103641 / GraBd1) TaxID=338963 RepID=Q3A1F6_SYNC1|nr:glutamine amidotransferase [Syntrophotalea carbinolica]ABA89801.1 glutamine-dependent amidotransferase, class I [Syntrophotalea carbinolica DSM 2380]
MGHIAIIEAGRTFPPMAAQLGDFSDWMAAGLKVDCDRLQVIPAFTDAALPAPQSLQGVVISGSHAMVTDACSWMERLADWLVEVVEASVPVLGVCFGHQLLARALGGEVGYHPRGREIGTVGVQLQTGAGNDPLFAGVASTFGAQVFHAQSVTQLPPGAKVLAGNDFEPHHAVAYREYAWGVQFHPEFDARIMRSYIAQDAGALLDDGFDIGTLLAGVQETPISAGLLARFARLTGA